MTGAAKIPMGRKPGPVSFYQKPIDLHGKLIGFAWKLNDSRIFVGDNQKISPRNASGMMGIKTIPVGITNFPMGKGTKPKGKALVPIGTEAFPIRKRLKLTRKTIFLVRMERKDGDKFYLLPCIVWLHSGAMEFPPTEFKQKSPARGHRA